MNPITCVNVATYENALTRGQVYEILANDAEKRQVKIRADNGRMRWFPLYCFEEGIRSLPSVVRIYVDDKIRNPHCDSAEVSIDVALDGEILRRWCYFLTPAYISQILEAKELEPVLLGKHGILLPVLTPESITRAITHLEKHNLLQECTLPLSS
jgi:hypothetical protein